MQQIHRKYHFELLASEALNSSSLALGGGVPESRQELRCLSLTHELCRGNSVSANERVSREMNRNSEFLEKIKMSHSTMAAFPLGLVCSSVGLQESEGADRQGSA